MSSPCYPATRFQGLGLETKYWEIIADGLLIACKCNDRVTFSYGQRPESMRFVRV